MLLLRPDFDAIIISSNSVSAPLSCAPPPPLPYPAPSHPRLNLNFPLPCPPPPPPCLLQVIWHAGMRSQLLQLLAEQRQNPDYTALVHWQHPVLARELIVAGVFVRVYNARPSSLPTDPQSFCKGLVRWGGGPARAVSGGGGGPARAMSGGGGGPARAVSGGGGGPARAVSGGGAVLQGPCQVGGAIRMPTCRRPRLG